MDFYNEVFERRACRRSNLQDVYKVGHRLAEPAPGVSWHGCSRPNKRLRRADLHRPQKLNNALKCERATPRDHVERLELCKLRLRARCSEPEYAAV